MATYNRIYFFMESSWWSPIPSPTPCTIDQDVTQECRHAVDEEAHVFLFSKYCAPF